MSRFFPFLLLSAALILGHAANPALGQLDPNGEPGIVNTVGYADVDPRAEIAVRPLDGSKENLEIKRRFESALQEAGYAVSDYTADIELSFETEVVGGSYSRDPGNLGSLEGGGGGVQLNFNIWSSSKDSLLGGRQKDKARRANIFHISAVLRNRTSGQTLWQGDAYSEMLTANTQHLAQSMIQPLVRNLGRSVEGEPFDIE